jgi:hypothetical protein
VNLDNAEKIFKILYSSMPSIGFLSRKKRILAFISVTRDLQSMIDAGDTDEEEAMFVLSMLMRKNKDFQKSALLTALNLQHIGNKSLTETAVKFAN